MKELKISAKGSRKIKEQFCSETEYIANFVNQIEIDLNYPHDRNFDSEIRFLAGLQKNNGLSYSLHAQYLSGGFNDVNERVRKESLTQAFKAIDLAKKLKAKVVTVHPALEPYGLKLPESLEWEINAYRQIARYAEKRNILVGLENEARTCFWFPDRACQLEKLIETIKQVGSDNFGHTLDIGHANVSGEDYIAAIKKMGHKLFHIHIHDNFGNPQINLEKCHRVDPHLPPGKGMIDWHSVIATLKESGYDDYLELECESHELENGLKYIREIEKELS